MRPPRPGSLRDEPDFVRWAGAESVSLFGTAVSTVVLPIVVYDATGSAAATGGLFALRVVPYLFLGLIAGPIADRGNRRVLIIGGNLVEGTLVATIPIAQLFGVLTVAQIYVVALLAATAFVFSDAAVFGAVPALVGPGRLAAANGMLSSLASTADIAGPVLGGVLVATIGATNAVWIDSASFFVAAAVQARIPSNFRDPASAPGEARLQIRSQVGRALRFIRGHRVLSTLILVGFGNSFAFGAVLGLIVPYAVERLGLASDAGRIGVLYGAIGVGGLIAGLAFSRVFRTERVARLVPSTITAAALFAALLAANSSWLLACGLLGAFSLSITTTISTGITYRQLTAPDDLRSSVNVIGRMISWGGQPFGAATGGLIAAATTVSTAYAVAALVMLTAGVAAALLLRRAG